MQTFKTLLFGAVAVMSATGLEAYTLTVDSVKNRYPWNGFVDIDYTIAYGDGEEPLSQCDDVLEVTLTDNGVSPAKTYAAHAFEQGWLPMTAGSHRITWDANYDGVTSVLRNATATIEVRHYPARYMVVDLRGGPTADSFPVAYLDGEPTGGFNHPKYKGDYMVFRRIHAGHFMMGSPSTEYLHDANGQEDERPIGLSKPYYIGLFEVTQRQYTNILAVANPSAAVGDFRPVEKVSWNSLRSVSQKGWPDDKSITAGSFIDVFRNKTGLDFDFPTAAQWEYACRAGTSSAVYTGVSPKNSTEYVTALADVARSKSNLDKGDGGYYEAHTTVGSYPANGFGLYDMLGNVREWVLDTCPGSRAMDAKVDPEGPSSSAPGTTSAYMRVARGGCHAFIAQFCRSAAHGSNNASSTASVGDAQTGFRLALTLP